MVTWTYAKLLTQALFQEKLVYLGFIGSPWQSLRNMNTLFLFLYKHLLNLFNELLFFKFSPLLS